MVSGNLLSRGPQIPWAPSLQARVVKGLEIDAPRQLLTWCSESNLLEESYLADVDYGGFAAIGALKLVSSERGHRLGGW